MLKMVSIVSDASTVFMFIKVNTSALINVNIAVLQKWSEDLNGIKVSSYFEN